MSERKLNIAIVGLGFGAEFIPIYQRHPGANMYAICQRTKEKLDQIGNAFGIEKRYANFAELIKDPKVDVVHINSPIHLHAPQSIAALKAGKHVACTVPAATTVAECKQIVQAAEKAKKNYMMMETVVYSREFLYVRELRDQGRLGRIQFLRGSHLQNMAGWPGYWEGLPPMHYATHCVSPCLAIVKGEADYVSCLGSGRIAEKTSFEWQLVEGDEPVLHVGGEKVEKVKVPDYAQLLPEPVRRFTTKGVYDAEEHQHLSFIQGSGHGGSHPHLAHEFMMSVLEGRPSFPDVYQSVNWTMVGICAHESAMRGGEIIKIPDFR